MSHLRDPAIRADIERRLGRIEGQIKALRRDAADGSDDAPPCDAVLGQITAIQGALNAVAARIVDENLVACVEADPHESREHALEVLRQAVRLLAR